MTMLRPADVLFVYDGTLEGFFSAVFDAYALHCWPSRFRASGAVQPTLGGRLRDVETDLAHAERVRVGLATRGGARLYRQVKVAFLSDEEGREDSLFSYIVCAMEEGYRVHSDSARPCVAEINRLVTQVYGERERVYQFLRFEQVRGGVYVAQISPKANVVPIMMQHFVDRFSTQPFLIYDDAHGIAALSRGGQCQLVLTDGIDIPKRTDEEELYQRLWKRFYDSVSIEQRYNPDLRTANMPKRFWKNLTEFKQAVPSRG